MALLHTPPVALGAPAPDFSLRAVDGKTYRLADIAQNRPFLVMFICNHCPYVKAIVARLTEATKKLQAAGIGVIAIMPNDAQNYPADSFENMKAFSDAHGFTFPYAIDETQAVARAYGAVCTPDFFGYNEALALQYRGRLDASKKEAAPESTPRELFEAMRMIALTGQGPSTQIPSVGCSIKWRSEPI